MGLDSKKFYCARNESLYFQSNTLSNKTLGGEKMVKKKGDKYECEECGLVIVVENPCGCSACDLICCTVPMKEVKPKAR